MPNCKDAFLPRETSNRLDLKSADQNITIHEHSTFGLSCMYAVPSAGTSTRRGSVLQLETIVMSAQSQFHAPSSTIENPRGFWSVQELPDRISSPIHATFNRCS